jgi:dethiobiotin synthetase
MSKFLPLDPLAWLTNTFLRHGGLFVTATDTGVGKTYLSCLIANEFRENGLDVGVMKPCESGSNDDAERLKRASASRDPLSLIRPYRFKAALAPGLAAELEGRTISLKMIRQTFRDLRAKHDGILVEGAGGLMVPLSKTEMVVDLAKRLALPILIVSRPGLGTINHSLLSLAEARRRGLTPAAVLINGKSASGDLSVAGNAAAIARYGKVPVIGPLKWGLKSLAGTKLWMPPR